MALHDGACWAELNGKGVVDFGECAMLRERVVAGTAVRPALCQKHGRRAEPEWAWEGPRRYVRNRVTRGSAAGANDGERCIMVGYSKIGNALGLCGYSFVNPSLVAKPAVQRGQGGSPDRVLLCPRCKGIDEIGA